MDWIRTWYEKIKPFFGIILLGFLVYAVVTGVLGRNRQDEYARTLESTVRDLGVVSNELGGVVSDISELKGGIEGIAGTARDLRELGSELRSTSDRLETAILDLGDQSTEAGLKADRLYRISREIAAREQEDTK